jgi:hypothetical protein
MVRNLLCHGRNLQMTLRPSSRNRDACGKNFRLCATRARDGRVLSHTSLCVEAVAQRVPVRWRVNARGFSKSFGGRLVQIRAIQAWNSERRAWSSAEEVAFGLARPCRLGAINALPLLARVFRAGRGRGERGSSPQGSGLLHLTGFKINCNKPGNN